MDLDSFDYTWYTIGMKECNNIPIIEPLEYSAEKVVDDINRSVQRVFEGDDGTAFAFYRST